MSLMTWGGILVYQPPRTSRASMPSSAGQIERLMPEGLKVWVGEMMGQRRPKSTLPQKGRGCSLSSRNSGHCAVTVIACAALFPSTSYAFACTLCGRRDYGSAKVCIF